MEKAIDLSNLSYDELRELEAMTIKERNRKLDTNCNIPVKELTSLRREYKILRDKITIKVVVPTEWEVSFGMHNYTDDKNFNCVQDINYEPPKLFVNRFVLNEDNKEKRSFPAVYALKKQVQDRIKVFEVAFKAMCEKYNVPQDWLWNKIKP